MRGRIIKGVGGFYDVLTEEGKVYACRARGIFRKENRKPLVGDQVEITVLDEKDMEGNLTQIYPRKTELLRPAVSNVDQAFVMFAMEDPRPSLLLLDRFLVTMEHQGVHPVICFNKKDLASPEEAEKLCTIYQSAGYRVIPASMATGEGLEEIRTVLMGKTTVVAGPSGVGKSSLANLLQGEVRMETGEISRKLKRGRHTTRHSQIIPVEGADLVDTPGFTALELEDMEEEQVKDCFPEFAPYEGKCRFAGCMHDREPDCAVKEALSRGEIAAERYENYLSLVQELKDKRRY